MRPPTKDHTNFMAKDEPSIDCSHDEDKARQEFKEEQSITHQLRLLGVMPPANTPRYGEWDDTIELQTAIHAVGEARAAWEMVPKELRDKFRSMEELLDAIERGELRITAEDAPQDPKIIEPVAPPATPTT